MKYLQRSLCISVLALALSLSASVPAFAADRPKASPKKRLPKPPAMSIAPRSGLMQDADLPGQAVYQILLAEVALQRGDPELASKAYADLALRTRDPKVLERTIEVAAQMRRFDLATDMARLWLDVEPESKDAQQMLTSVMIQSNQLDQLAPNLVRMLETDKDALPQNLLGLNRMFARNPDRQAVFRLIDRICQSFANIPEAHYAVSMAAGSAGVYERALAEIQRAIELRPDWEMAALLEAQLLSRESPAKAIGFMQDFVTAHPQARDLQLNLARVLVSEKRYAEARVHFDQLLKDYPDKPEIAFSVALLAFQQNDLPFAESLLKKLLSSEVPDKTPFNYYLGQIAEEGKRNDEALAYYAKVGAGEQLFPARVRSAHLLADQGQLDAGRKLLSEVKSATPEEQVQWAIAEAALLREAKQPQAAFELLDQHLAKEPEQADLLYETALLAEKLDRIDLLESRLRKLIELHPDNAQAFNALGYSYAERNLRLPEAQTLIETALKLKPDDSFILDSMGWVLYRRGDLPGALARLEEAYAKRDDPEIAAHLGEVLWALGRKDDAQRTWQDAQKKYPANEAVADTIKKFVP